jgi:hypothetical protein
MLSRVTLTCYQPNTEQPETPYVHYAGAQFGDLTPPVLPVPHLPTRLQRSSDKLRLLFRRADPGKTQHISKEGFMAACETLRLEQVSLCLRARGAFMWCA